MLFLKKGKDWLSKYILIKDDNGKMFIERNIKPINKTIRVELNKKEFNTILNNMKYTLK